LVWVGHF
jgi:hypothetical protein